MVAGPSKTGMTKEEKASTVQGKGKEKDVGGGDGDELGRWDVVLRREVGGKPVTVFDVRYVNYPEISGKMGADMVVRMVTCSRSDVQICLSASWTQRH